LSGAACAERLTQLGFRVVHRGKGTTPLRRDDRRVLVPDVDVVGADLLDAILRSAGVTLRELLGIRAVPQDLWAEESESRGCGLVEPGRREAWRAAAA